MPRNALNKGNRTDLPTHTPAVQVPGQPNGRPVQPNVQPTGLPYGQAGQLHQAQAAAAVPNGQAGLAQALQDARNMPSPAQSGVTPLDAPTERPNEHIMTGALPPNGIGQPAGPLGGLQAGPGQNGMADMLDQVASVTGSPRLQALAAAARSGQ